MLRLALMSSENRAASTLARHYPGGMLAFVAAMNDKAMALGMTRTHYDDATGLSPRNVSTANDLAKLVRAAADYPTSSAITRRRPSHFVEVQPTGQTLGFNNSNALVKNGAWDIQLQKTGYIREAGRCVVMLATIASKPMVIVLLDSIGKFTRVADAQRVKHWLETGESLPAAAFKAVMKQPAAEADAEQAHPGQVRRHQGAQRLAWRVRRARVAADSRSASLRRDADSPPAICSYSSFACARVFAVISAPPSILASSSTRDFASSCARSLTTSSSRLALAHAQVRVRERRHLRQVRHAQHLPRRAPSACMSPPTVAATAPPMPASTSSNTSVGTAPASLATTWTARARCATARRPTPRARAAPAACAGWLATRNSTPSTP